MSDKTAFGKSVSSQNRHILENVIAGKLKKAEAARRIGVSRKTVYAWLKRYKVSVGTKVQRDKRHKEHKGTKKRENFKKDILRIITVNPGFGPQKISTELKKKQKYLSSRSAWLVLKKLNLNSSEKRISYAYKYRKPTQAKDPNFPVHLRLNPEARKRMVEEVVLAGRKVGEVCSEFQVPRKTFAKWKERYVQAQKAGENILSALTDQ